MQARPEEARAWGQRALNRALDGVKGVTAVHDGNRRNVIVCTDCGMKYLPRDVAFGKMQAMVEGASIVRRELAGSLP